MAEEPAQTRQRIDKWLFFTRMAKSRSLAQNWIEAGHVAINGDKTRKPSAEVRIGDEVEIATRERHSILVVKGPGNRRGPFEEASQLYEDISPPRPKATPFDQATREAGTGRPEKKDRRQIDRLRNRYPDEI